MTVPAYRGQRSDHALSVSASPQGAPPLLREALTSTLSDQSFRVYAATLALLADGATYVTENVLGAMLHVPPARCRHALGELSRAGLLRRRTRAIDGSLRATYEVVA